MKAPLITLSLTAALAFLVACSEPKGKESDNAELEASINPDGSCTEEYIRKYNEVVNQAKTLQENVDRKMTSDHIVSQAQALKKSCDGFYAKHNNINCKVEIDHSVVKIGSAAHKQKCEAARQLIDSNQTPYN